MSEDVFSYSNKRTKTKIRLIIIAVASIITVAVIILSVFLNSFSYRYRNINAQAVCPKEKISAKIENIALFGIDTRTPDDFTGRSDAIMILSVDTDKCTVKIVSVMRDSLVNTDLREKPLKLCEVYSCGGAKASLKTINDTFDLDISEYATVNFAGMVKIIDAIGGIEAEVTKEEIPQINGLCQQICKAFSIEKPDKITSTGKQVLMGANAVGWARIRHVPTAGGLYDDYGRTYRQRAVMSQIFTKLKSMPKTAYISLIKQLMPCVETSLSYTDIIMLGSVFLRNPEFSETRVPEKDYLINDDYRIDGASTVFYDTKTAGKRIKEFLYSD